MEKNISKLAVIIGRFQTPYLHAGHLHLIATALRECDRTIILLGCQYNKDERNPFDIPDRIQMINKIFPQIGIFPLFDHPDDEEWSRIIDGFNDSFYYNDDVCLYHSRDSFIKQYHGTIKTKEVEEIEGYSATKIREQLK